MAESELKRATGFLANLRSITRAERVVAIIALHIVAGWVVQFLRAEQPRELLGQWFPLLSFSGALVVALLVILRLFGVRLLPQPLARRVIAVVCLFPLLGFLLQIVASPGELLTKGGSLALAYAAVAMFWRTGTPATETAK